MAETPMQGLADYLRRRAVYQEGCFEQTLLSWASEVEAARASLPAPTDAEWMKEAEALVARLDGYLNSPEQVTLGDELRAAIRAYAESLVQPARSSGFSDFIRNASDDEKAAVYGKVIDGAIRRQQEALDVDARRLVDECAQFLKEGETPAQCIARNRHDAFTAIRLYYNDAQRYGQLRAMWLDRDGDTFATMEMCRAETADEFDKALDALRGPAVTAGAKGLDHG